MRSGWAGMVAALLVASCSESLPPVQLTSVEGIWDWTATIVDGTSTCHDTGSLVLEQVDSTFTGRSRTVGTCISPLGTFPTSRLDSVHGVVSGDELALGLRVFFSGVPDRCTLAGDISVATDTTISGTGFCGTGSVLWQAVPQRALASVTVAPATETRVVGGSATFEAQLRSTAGDPVFFRPVTWSTSNTAIAVVDTIGFVLATGGGVATITAASEAHSGQATLTVPVPAGFTQVAAGNAFSCGLDPAGKAYCWGLVIGAQRTPTPVPGNLQFTSLGVSRAEPHQAWACGLTAAGAAWCWGDNDHGQLGNGTQTPSDTPVQVSGGQTFTQVSVGGLHACGRTSSGAVYCWGENGDGQLGDGGTTDSPVPVPVSGAFNASAVSAGGTHTCAIHSSTGAAWCWGNGDAGRLGDSTFVDRSSPGPVYGSLVFTAISAGVGQTCGVAAGSGYCWGINTQGQLGVGSTIEWVVPAPVTGGLTFTSISIGSIHACGLTTGGAAYCWGVNSFGQLGTGSFAAVMAPVAVTGGHAFASISAGVYLYSDEAHNAGTAAHTCGVTAGGITYCWGDNLIGQIGDGAPGDSRNAPAKVAGQP